MKILYTCLSGVELNKDWGIGFYATDKPIYEDGIVYEFEIPIDRVGDTADMNGFKFYVTPNRKLDFVLVNKEKAK